MSQIGEVQRSQLITTYGIGSIYDALDYSVVIAGLEDWQINHTEIIIEERLQKKLQVKLFRQPRIIDDVPTIPCYRFPEWVFCPKCKKLKPIYKLQNRTDKKCPRCKEKYLPARFVVSCSKGHLNDFPWIWWVHKNSDNGICENPILKLNTTGKTTSLAGISVSCECGAEETLGGIFGKNALKGLKCRGKRPWLGFDNQEDCDETPRVLQRGSASVYYSITESAISIPPFSERLNIFLRQFEDEIQCIDEAILPKYLQAKLDKSGESFRIEDLIRAAKKFKEPENKVDINVDLRQAEYEALCHPSAIDYRDEFVAAEEDIPEIFRAQISKLVLVHRLREVRALTEFSRIEPDGPPAPLSKKPQDWLPASEMKGEGIFIELDIEAINDWTKDATPDFLERIKKLENLRHEQHLISSARAEKRKITPLFLLIHTMAHILIQQLILDCGYSSSSLRERLYINDGSDGSPVMSGFLIYTSTSDSEGSLGGLVRQGEKQRFSAVMKKALEHARWCSNDPLCMESEGQGHNSLNLAACHSCCLLPETSCELRNCYLDRGVVVGINGIPETGFFPEEFYE